MAIDYACLSQQSSTCSQDVFVRRPICTDLLGGERSGHWGHATPRVRLEGIPQAGSGETSPAPTHNSPYPEEDVGHMVEGTGEMGCIHALGCFLHVLLRLPAIGGDSGAF